MYGFHGKTLHIDLSERTIWEEELSDDILRETLGGKGLAAHLLRTHLPAGVEPLAPENLLVFATGPASDTAIPAASRFGVYAKSPLTGLFGESYSGGHVAPMMKRTGYDAIVIGGAATGPTYLSITDEGVEFRDAADLWGETTDVAEEALLERAGIDGGQALVIGPAGENLVAFACIKNNRWRSAGRNGMGAVMGSKGLKGLVFGGSTRAELADEAGLREYVREMVAECRDTKRTNLMRTYGTPYMVATTNAAHAFPSRYWAQGSLENWEGISAREMHRVMDVKPKACRGCFMACGKLSTVKSGRHRGLTIEGPEYETIYALGGICCVDRIEEVAYLNDICDKLGLDTISGGNMAGLAIEAGMRGKVEEAPSYGDVDGIARLFEDIAHRRGIGDLLARGVREVARELGLEDLAVHVKGQEPAGYDPRTLRGMSLGYAVSSRGACHLRSSYYMQELDHQAPEDLLEKTADFLHFESRNALEDCLILCRFYQKFIGWDGMARILAVTTGMQLDEREMKALAMGATTAVKRFNLREGWSRADDALPARLFEEPVGPEGEFVADREELEVMLREYYRLHGWDAQGVPSGE